MRKERPHIVQLYIIDLRLSFCSCGSVCVQINIFTARVLHISAFINLVFDAKCTFLTDNYWQGAGLRD